MADSLVKDLIEAGIHYGQRASNWNPRMKPYIYGKRNGIHIIDIKETVKGLLLARRFITQTVASGKDVCFVGTKRQAKDIIAERVADVGMHWVTERWLGGTLTNFRTIRLRLKRLEELEAIEAEDNYASYSKKMESQLRREQRKIYRNLTGIRKMDKLPGALIVIKHFSFFSFLGPHRYASTNIPWGHLLLTDDEYRRFAHEFHAHRADQMIDFYFNGLAFPRVPMSRLVRMALDYGFVPQVIINEPLRNIADFYPLARKVDNFWSLVAENWPDVSAEELFSGRYHMIFRKLE